MKVFRKGKKDNFLISKNIKEFDNKKNKKFKIRKVITRLFAATLVFFIIISIFTGVTILRYRQLCSYSTQLDSGKLTTASERDFCPNFLDQSTWGNIVSNLSSIDIENDFEVVVSNANQINNIQEACTDQLNPVCWIQGTTAELKQTPDGFTNIFIVGTDSSDLNDYRANLKNTDSMMLVTIDNKTGGVLFTSFPRDTYLSYFRPNGTYVSYKLNAVYSIDGATGLNGVIEQVTGQPIHYYGYINLTLFTNIIDSLGGVEITLDEPFYDLYPCKEVPQDIQCFGTYGAFEFPAGTQRFDSFDASVYSRARLNSSDFDRARRQQEILKALVKNILENEEPLTDRLSTYIDLYNIFRSEVESNIELADVGAIFSLTDILERNGAQMVLTPDLGGFGSIIVDKGFIEGLGYNIGFADESYQTFQNYRNNILNNLAFYTDQPQILIEYANGESKILAEAFANEYGEFANIKIQENKKALSGIRIYQLSDKNMSSSIRYITQNVQKSLLFNANIDNINQSEFKEDILISFN